MLIDNLNLNTHITKVHSVSLEQRKVHQCPQCDKKFADEKKLKRHIMATHMKLKEYRCNHS